MDNENERKEAEADDTKSVESVVLSKDIEVMPSSPTYMTESLEGDLLASHTDSAEDRVLGKTPAGE